MLVGFKMLTQQYWLKVSLKRMICRSFFSGPGNASLPLVCSGGCLPQNPTQSLWTWGHRQPKFQRWQCHRNGQTHWLRRRQFGSQPSQKITSYWWVHSWPVHLTSRLPTKWKGEIRKEWQVKTTISRMPWPWRTLDELSKYLGQSLKLALLTTFYSIF